MTLLGRGFVMCAYYFGKHKPYLRCRGKIGNTLRGVMHFGLGLGGGGGSLSSLELSPATKGKMQNTTKGSQPEQCNAYAEGEQEGV